MKRNNILALLIILIIISPIQIFSQNEKTLLIFVENMDIKLLNGMDNLGVSMVNIKTQVDNKRSFYSSLNLGRSVKSLENGNFSDSLGENLSDRGLSYLGDKNSDLKYLVMDSKGSYNQLAYNKDNVLKDIDRAFESVDILAIELEDNILIDEIYMENKDKLVYFIPLSINKSSIINSKFGFMAKSGGSGILTSNSTKREGIITLEDITEDIKINYGLENKFAIGRKINLIYNNNPLREIEDIYTRILNVYFGAILYQGLVMLSIFLYALVKYKNIKLDVSRLLLFSFSGVLTTFIAGLISLDNNIFLYLGFSLILSGIIIKYSKSKIFLNLLQPIGYFAILFSVFFWPEFIYKSYLGFNNVLYGMRYYGLNNGMAGAILGLSIIVNWQIFKDINNKYIKIFAIIIPIINMLSMSTKFGANTGGFLTATFLLIATISHYIFDNKKYIFSTIAIILIILIVTIFNFKIFKISGVDSHLAKFILRVNQNGYIEILDMGINKIKELIKLSITPPVLISLASIIYIFKTQIKGDKIVDIALKTSIFGYIINDTGYELFIYIMGYTMIYDLFLRIDLEYRGGQ